jgi:hypothetical protein
VFILESEIALALKTSERLYYDKLFGVGRLVKKMSFFVASVICDVRQTTSVMMFNATKNDFWHKVFECSYLRVKLLLHRKQLNDSALMNNLGLEGLVKKSSFFVASVICDDRQRINYCFFVNPEIIFGTRSLSVHT